MAGIYLHIPFCKQACTYCNFHFTTSLRGKDGLLGAMRKEIVAEKAYLRGETVRSIYFGGGTPSLLETSELGALISDLYAHYAVAPDAEITLEANPDDIHSETLRSWKEVGINRLSIGVQSFFEAELKWMNRAHTAQQAFDNLQLATREFDNITLDLIYGSPLLTDAMWKQNVDTALALGVPHLSCYALTVEEKTPLHKNIGRRLVPEVDDEQQARQFLLLMQWLRNAGYEHYEVSNFAKPGFRSRHNSSYWQGTPYLGIGPSAHSYNGVERRWNVANNTVYTNGISTGNPAREAEVLTPTQRFNEMLMISLRTTEGIDLAAVEATWGRQRRLRLENGLRKFLSMGLLTLQNEFARLTDAGMLRADGIAADLFEPDLD